MNRIQSQNMYTNFEMTNSINKLKKRIIIFFRDKSSFETINTKVYYVLDSMNRQNMLSIILKWL